MSMPDSPLINRVANSGLITLNLELYYPEKPIRVFDLKDFLFHGLILKEKEFRESLKGHDWEQYRGHHLAVFCSTDAIIPVWAYMLVVTMATPHAERIHLGTPEDFLAAWYREVLAPLDLAPFRDQRVVIKGCSDKPVPAAAYMEMTRLLLPFAQSIMYGEPCSTVPVFKRPRVVVPKNTAP